MQDIESKLTAITERAFASVNVFKEANAKVFELCKQRRLEEALSIFKKRPTNVAAAKLISLTSDLAAAFNIYSILDDDKTSRVRPDTAVISPVLHPGTWTALINSYAMAGQGKDAIATFRRMIEEAHVIPDAVTLQCVLNGCSHAGLVKEALSLISSMENLGHGMLPRPKEEHYTCVVDALARAGRLKDAEAFMGTMSIKPTLLMWKTMLGACRYDADSTLAERYAANALALISLDEKASVQILRGSIFATQGRWDDHQRVSCCLLLPLVSAAFFSLFRYETTFMQQDSKRC